MPDDRFSPASLPRPLRIALVALAALLLTSFFVYLGFPYDLLASRLAAQVEQSTGTRIRYGVVAASPQLLGPGIAVSDLRLRTPNGESWEFSRVTLRPAWSLSWLRGQPALHVDADASFGQVDGSVRIGDEPGFDGDASDLDLGTLMRLASIQGGLTGVADLETDLRFGADGTEGPLRLSARDGVISHPSLPLDVPYQQLDAQLVFGGENLLEIVSCEIRSPMGTGSMEGSFGRAAAVANAPLDLRIDIEAAENMRAVLRSQRVAVGEDGRIQLSVRGTMARPVVR